MHGALALCGHAANSCDVRRRLCGHPILAGLTSSVYLIPEPLSVRSLQSAVLWGSWSFLEIFSRKKQTTTHVAPG